MARSVMLFVVLVATQAKAERPLAPLEMPDPDPRRSATVRTSYASIRDRQGRYVLRIATVELGTVVPVTPRIAVSGHMPFAAIWREHDEDRTRGNASLGARFEHEPEAGAGCPRLLFSLALRYSFPTSPSSGVDAAAFPAHSLTFPYDAGRYHPETSTIRLDATQRYETSQEFFQLGVATEVVTVDEGLVIGSMVGRSAFMHASLAAGIYAVPRTVALVEATLTAPLVGDAITDDYVDVVVDVGARVDLSPVLVTVRVGVPMRSAGVVRPAGSRFASWLGFQAAAVF
jgi:hypothetical protein